jgi:hypothetical protein
MKTAQKENQKFTQTELKEKHQAALAKREAMRIQNENKRVLAKQSANKARGIYLAHPSMKNYRDWRTAETRASKAGGNI